MMKIHMLLIFSVSEFPSQGIVCGKHSKSKELDERMGLHCGGPLFPRPCRIPMET